jgi:hypothetical protein
MIELLDTVVALALCFGAVWLVLNPRRARAALYGALLKSLAWLPSPARTGVYTLVGMYAVKRLQRHR